MAIKVKNVTASATKWADNAARASDAYAQEAAASADTWATNTQASADNFGAAISAPGIKDRFRRGVAKAGAAKYKRKIEDVAKARFGPGVAAAESDYSTNVEPFLTTIAALTLSPRKPKGSPENYRRVEEVGKALNAKRLALLGVGG